jgi:hypothetical protein
MAAPIIIGGCGRSGTTLLRMMLDAHPRIACGPELKAIPLIAEQFAATQRLLGRRLQREFGLEPADVARAYGATLAGLLETYRQRRGKPRIAEKTPQNIHHFSALSAMLPDAYLIHLIRDGRDVIVSLLRQNWVDLATRAPVAYTKTARAAARFWVAAVRAGRRIHQHPSFDRYREVRYEDLVTRPEQTLRDLLDHIGESWDDAVLSFHEYGNAKVPQSERASHGDALGEPVHGRAVGQWKSVLSKTQKEVIKEEAGPLLIELGYVEDDTW